MSTITVSRPASRARCEAAARRLDRVLRVGAEDGDLDLPAELLELVDRGGALQVGGDRAPACGPACAGASASFAAVVVLPEPCRPASRMTVNFPNASPDSPSPISSVSSSWTTFTTCWPGVRLFRTSSPSAFSRTRATKSRTTVKLTSASSSARRISRIAREIDSSSRLPFLRRSPRALCSLSDRLSNTTAHRSRGRSTSLRSAHALLSRRQPLRRECSTAAAAEAGSSCPRSRSGSGTTSAATAPSRRAARILRRAFDLGVTHFDLANNYGPPYGSAEETFGRVLRDDLRPYRDELVISTKAGYDMWPGPYGEWGSRKYLLASLDQSLRADGPRLRRHLLLAPLRPGHAARGDDGRARHGGAPGQGALRRHLVVLAREDARGGRDPR